MLKSSNNGYRKNMAELNNIEDSDLEAGLSPVEQAAIVLLSIGEEQAAAVLRCLERDELMELTQVMSRMSGIKVDTVKSALQTFFDDYRQQSGLHGASRRRRPRQPSRPPRLCRALPPQRRSPRCPPVSRRSKRPRTAARAPSFPCSRTTTCRRPARRSTSWSIT